MANQFLIKETMADMRGLSAAEITALQNGTYEGVQLLGYYEKGDTPAPIVYYYVNPLTDPDPGVDDGGSIVEVSGIKLLHTFIDRIDVRYYGTRGNGTADDITFLEKAHSAAERQNLPLFSNSVHYISRTFNVFLKFLFFIEAELLIDSPSITAMIIGNRAGVRLTDAVIHTPVITNRLFTTNFNGFTNMGLDIRGARRSKFVIGLIRGFKNGIRIYSSLLNGVSDDFTWNNVQFTSLLNNETQWHIHIVNQGYVNQNTFENFMCSKFSTTDKIIDKQLVTTNETGLRRIDGNLFLNCAFESAYPYTAVTDLVELKQISYCTFIGCRYEFTAGNKYILLDGGEYNRFIGGYGLRKEYFRFINNPNYTIQGMDWDDYSFKRITYNGGGIDLRGQGNIRSYGTVYPRDVINNGDTPNNHVDRIYLSDDKYSERQYNFTSGPILQERIRKGPNPSWNIIEYFGLKYLDVGENAEIRSGNTVFIKNRAYLESTFPTPSNIANGQRAYNSTRRRLACTNGTVWFDFDGVPLGTLRRGATNQRPAIMDVYDGFVYMDTILQVKGKPIWKSGADWVDAGGNVV